MNMAYRIHVILVLSFFGAACAAGSPKGSFAGVHARPEAADAARVQAAWERVDSFMTPAERAALRPVDPL